MTLMEMYNENYIPAFKERHEDMEPACFEEWKDNELREDMEKYLDNQSYADLMYIVYDAINNNMPNIPCVNEMDSIDDFANGNFINFYQNIDHDNFNVADDVFYGDYNIKSCSYAQFIDDYMDTEDMTDYIIDNFERLKNEIDLVSEYEYEY